MNFLNAKKTAASQEVAAGALKLIDAPDALEIAATALAEVRAREAEIISRVSAMKLALSYRVGGAHPDVNPEFDASAAPYLIKASRWPDQLAEDIDNLEHELAELKPTILGATEDYQEKAEKATDAIARTLRPAYLNSIREIAKALETLSRALETERRLQEELRRRAPLAGSQMLMPSFSFCLASMRTDDPQSAASAWGRAAIEVLNARV